MQHHWDNHPCHHSLTKYQLASSMLHRVIAKKLTCLSQASLGDMSAGEFAKAA
jgi:hypothetical protein